MQYKKKYPMKEYKRIHFIYYGMRKRCYNPNCKRYKDYGGRGIKICEEWYNSSDAFVEWSLNNGYSDDLTIDRIDVNGDYSPENCKWSTYIEQCNNTRNTIYVEYKGIKKPLTIWCRELNLNYDTVHGRIRDCGWSVERAFNEKSLQENSLSKICKEHNIKERTVLDRINKLGWDLETALTTPVIKNGVMHKDIIVKCPVCNREFRKKNGLNMYCSEVCRKIAKSERKKLRERNNKNC